MKNYYQFLGLERTATPEEIKKAYRNYAKRFHPDKHDNDNFFKERFQEIEEAYHVLSDPDRRSEYDNLFFKQSETIFQETFHGQKEDDHSNSNNFEQNERSYESSSESFSETDRSFNDSGSTKKAKSNFEPHWSDNWGYPLFFLIGVIIPAMVLHTLKELLLEYVFSDESTYDNFQYSCMLIGGFGYMIYYHFNDGD